MLQLLPEDQNNPSFGTIHAPNADHNVFTTDREAIKSLVTTLVCGYGASCGRGKLAAAAGLRLEHDIHSNHSNVLLTHLLLQQCQTDAGGVS